MTDHLRELLTWLATGSTSDVGAALTALHSALKWSSALAITLFYYRTIAVLGAGSKPESTSERQAYDRLRNSLAEGNMATRLYALWLNRLLDWVESFFGDVGTADRTLFPHAFGLRTPAPLWTAPAFDRCLILAFIYPIATVFAIWVCSGHVALAQTAFWGLTPNLAFWRRGLVAVAFSSFLLAMWRGAQSKGWKRLGWSTCVLVTSSIGFVVGIGALIYAGWAASLGSYLLRKSLSVKGCVLILIGSVLGLTVIGGEFIQSMIGYLGIVVVFGSIAALVSLEDAASIENGKQGSFLVQFLFLMVIVCLGAAYLLSSLDSWSSLGFLLLFLGLLTLLNAPFDWASLGLTRALLRRGLELGGWWPYALAFVDAGLAAAIIVALALTMVVAVQVFDTLAVYGGGAPVLPLSTLFSGIAADPTAPEYWWIYALLFSTMIPSLVNLVIGGTSLVRGLPGVPSLLLKFIPARGTVPKFDRAWIATVLTAQVAAGAALGIVAQIFLVWVIIGLVMPLFGLELLGMARVVAAFNLPARVGQLFGVSL